MPRRRTIYWTIYTDAATGRDWVGADVARELADNPNSRGRMTTDAEARAAARLAGVECDDMNWVIADHRAEKTN